MDEPAFAILLLSAHSHHASHAHTLALSESHPPGGLSETSVTIHHNSIPGIQSSYERES